jgi:hypothetical protein
LQQTFNSQEQIIIDDKSTDDTPELLKTITDARVSIIKKRGIADAPIAHPTVFFMRSLLEKHGYYSNKGLWEDIELWLRWMSHGVQFSNVPEVLYEWSDYPNRTSRVHPNYSLEKFYR